MKVMNQFVAVAFAVILLATSAKAGEPCRKFLGCPVPDCIGKWCCDDYQSKCLPCVKVPLCFGCDNYCRKSLPRICAPLCFTCDDYCRKCQPPVCRPPLLATLQCAPQRASGRCSACATAVCDQAGVTGTPVHVPRVPSADAAKEVMSIGASARVAESVHAPGTQDKSKPVIIEIFRR